MTSPRVFLFSLLALLSLASTAQAEETIALDFGLPGEAASGSSEQPVAERQALSFVPPESYADAAERQESRSGGTAVRESEQGYAADTARGNAPQVGPLFAGGSESLVARTVGHAEGTRSADGGKTEAYYGHSDPGNAVWNLGSFSFQHCPEAQYNCSTPEQADEHQLARLQGQAQQLRQRAASQGLTLSLEEELNGIDLANQAPLAALDSPGYIEWLRQARQRGLKGEEAVLWARTQSYWDPQLNNWNAPGLGNQEEAIRYDQNRRLQAIASALEVYQQSQPAAEQRADQIIFQSLQ